MKECTIEPDYSLIHIGSTYYRAAMGFSLQEGWDFVAFLPEMDEAGLPLWEIVSDER